MRDGGSGELCRCGLSLFFRRSEKARAKNVALLQLLYEAWQKDLTAGSLAYRQNIHRHTCEKPSWSSLSLSSEASPSSRPTRSPSGQQRKTVVIIGLSFQYRQGEANVRHGWGLSQ